jgi:non-ribosomal peptide synthetase component F
MLVSSLPLVSDATTAKIATWNRTEPDYHGDGLCMHHMVERQVAKTPDTIAVEQVGGGNLSYRSLNAKANAVARQLLDGGVCVEDSVILMFNPGKLR